MTHFKKLRQSRAMAVPTGAVPMGTQSGVVSAAIPAREIRESSGAQPLPRKEVITTVAERTKPQHSMILNWDLGAKFDDQLFAFVPPAKAHQITFDTDSTHKAGAK